MSRTSVSRAGSRIKSGIGSKWLVGTEVVLATVLCVGAALTLRSANHLASQDMGVVSEGVLTTYFGDVGHLPVAQRAEYFRQVIIAVEAVPGVQRVGTNDYRPFQGEDDFGLKGELLREVLAELPQQEVLKVIPETALTLSALSSLGQQYLAAYLRDWQANQSIRLG